jgi:hypothetical protein
VAPRPGSVPWPGRTNLRQPTTGKRQASSGLRDCARGGGLYGLACVVDEQRRGETPCLACAAAFSFFIFMDIILPLVT